MKLVALLVLFMSLTSVGYAVACYETGWNWHRYRWWGCADNCSVQGNCCCDWECSLGAEIKTFMYCQAAGTCTWPIYSPCGLP